MKSKSPEPFEISPQEVAEMLRTGAEARLFDVREDFEIQIASIKGAEQLTEPLAREILERGDKDELYVFICHHGVRSYSAAAFFAEQGFTRAASMRGGIDAWSAEIDPSVPTY